MKDIARWAVFGFFGAIIAAIVFVKAGRGGAKSGGDQTAEIVRGGGDALAKVASGLEGA
jgi:hypothetical protein